VSQKSIYFRDPDGNLLEIYYELPNAEELFASGRQIGTSRSRSKRGGRLGS